VARKDPSKNPTCDDFVENITLQDVETAEYHSAEGKPPMTDTQVRLRSEKVDGRLAVETMSDQRIVGFMPDKYDYLVDCLAKGYVYVGRVIFATREPLRVRVDLRPKQEYSS